MSAINILKEGEKEISALISHACLGKSYIFILFSLSTTRFCSESLSYLIILMTDKFSFFYLFFCKAFQRSSHKEELFLWYWLFCWWFKWWDEKYSKFNYEKNSFISCFGLDKNVYKLTKINR